MFFGKILFVLTAAFMGCAATVTAQSKSDTTVVASKDSLAEDGHSLEGVIVTAQRQLVECTCYLATAHLSQRRPPYRGSICQQPLSEECAYQNAHHARRHYGVERQCKRTDGAYVEPHFKLPFRQTQGFSKED